MPQAEYFMWMCDGRMKDRKRVHELSTMPLDVVTPAGFELLSNSNNDSTEKSTTLANCSFQKSGELYLSL